MLAKLEPGRSGDRRRVQAPPASQARSLSRRRRQAAACIPTTIASSPSRPMRRCRRRRCRCVMLDDIEAIANVLQAEALPLEQIGSSSVKRRGGEPDGAAQRRLLRLQRTAASGRRRRASDRRARRRRSPDKRRVPLREARGRVLADDIIAPVNVPPFDNSAVDGYAVRADDLERRHARRASPSSIGSPPAMPQATRVKAGEAIRIFTGAPMPAGADTVFMQEDCRVDGDSVDRAARPEARRQPPACRRGHARRRAWRCRPAGGSACSTWRSPPRSVSPSLMCAGACGSPCSRPATRSSSRARRCRARRSTIPTAICWPACSRAFGAEVTDLGILSDDPKAARARASPRPPPTTIWCSPRAASRPAKPIMCAARSKASAASCSGASRSSRAGRWRWA